jgi:hypothetical protein
LLFYADARIVPHCSMLRYRNPTTPNFYTVL